MSEKGLLCLSDVMEVLLEGKQRDEMKEKINQIPLSDSFEVVFAEDFL